MQGHRASPGTDVVVIAGNIHPGVFGALRAAEMFAPPPILYVPGNQEHHGRRGFRRHRDRMRLKGR